MFVSDILAVTPQGKEWLTRVRSVAGENEPPVGPVT